MRLMDPVEGLHRARKAESVAVIAAVAQNARNAAHADCHGNQYQRVAESRQRVSVTILNKRLTKQGWLT